jgi:hypothetical protein
LNFLRLHHLLAGELATAERLIDEDRLLTAWQGHPDSRAYPLATLRCPPGRRDPSPPSTTMTGTQSPRPGRATADRAHMTGHAVTHPTGQQVMP